MNIQSIPQQGSATLEANINAEILSTGEVHFTGPLTVMGKQYDLDEIKDMPVPTADNPTVMFYVTDDGRVTSDPTDPHLFTPLAWVSGDTLSILNHAD